MLAVLDWPTGRDAVDRFGFVATGWVWGGPQADRISAVELWAGDKLLGESDALTSRPDVCEALGIDAASRTGFEIVAHHPSAPRGSTIELQLRVRFRDGSRTCPLCAASVRTLGSDEPPRDVATMPGDAFPGGERGGSGLPFIEGIALPPDPLQVRQVGGVWGRDFFRAGRDIMNQLAAAFVEAGSPLRDAKAILDFGCGCGRVLCSLGDMPHSGAAWGCDIDAEAIAWSEANLGHLATFRATPPVPPTSFSNGQFDAIYSVSVFTHLPEELQFAWLTELRRILRPGGVLVASLHGGKVWSGADANLRRTVATRGFAYHVGAPTPGLPAFYMLAFHSEAYVRAKWTRFFELVAYREAYIHGAHDAVVMRRPAD